MAVTNRVEKIRQNYVGTMPHISYERAWAWTISKNTAGFFAGYTNFENLTSGGTLLNLRLNHDLVATKRGRANLGAMLQSYFTLGGFPVQFNTVSNEELKDAQKNPEKYRSLLVRVAGYSAQFTNHSKEMQDSIMARNVHADFYRPDTAELERLKAIVQVEGVALADFT